MSTAELDPIPHACRLLREGAAELKNCHTLAATGHDWTGEPEAKAAYDEHMATADALERVHAENETLRTGYAAARLEIESLNARIQWLIAERDAAREVAMMNAEAGAAWASAAQAAPAAVAGPSDSAIPGRLGYSTLMRLADENGLGPNNVSGKLQARIELYGRAVERAAIRAQQQLSSVPTAHPAPPQEAQEPVAWYVTGCGRLLDEYEAEAEARRIGGTAKAMPLYTVPQPSPASQGDVLDAERYRYLRDVPMDQWPAELLTAIRLQQNAKWDTNIDAARVAQEGK